MNAFCEPGKCEAKLLVKHEEITEAWLGLALGGATVESFTKEICEQGQCALTVLIKDIKFGAASDKKPPTSLAIKMHGQTDEQRTMFSGLGHYTKEAFFYTSFADKVPLKTPGIYGIWTDVSEEERKGGATVAYFNLVMEDMNQGFRTYNPVVDGAHSDLKETEEMLMLARELHVKYFKSSVITEKPFSNTGSNFSLDAKRPYVGYAAASWPPVKENMPKLSEFEGGAFPKYAEQLVKFYDEYLADNGKKASQFVDALEKLWKTRPMTLNHGDFNCGNVWQKKEDPSPTSFVFADWQMYEMAPIGLDIESMLITLGSTHGGKVVTELMDKYHSGLPAEVQSDYTRVQLQVDFKGQLVIVSLIIVAIMAGQLDTSAMPPEKSYFCWKMLWPRALNNFGTLFADLEVMEFVETIMKS
jgi:hypothetical protein